MTSVNKKVREFCQPATHLDWWLSWIGIFVGCTVLASGFVLFINPYNIVPGGVYGASIVLHNLFPSVQVGTFGYMFDIPLLIISWLVLGSKLGTRTVVAAMSTPFIMNMMSIAVYPTREALEALDPALMLGGCMDMTNHLMLTTIIGAAVIGVGCGLIVRCQATSGGSDIVAMIMHKYLHMRFATALLMVDGLVVLSGLVVIGFGVGGGDVSSSSPSWHLSLYSLIAIYITARVIDRVINGAKDDKLLFVISDREMLELHQFILQDLDRSATLIKSSGLYTGKDKEMLFLVVSYKEVSKVKSKIKETDPHAFVIVTDAYDTYGEGWKQLPNANELQPE